MAHTHGTGLTRAWDAIETTHQPQGWNKCDYCGDSLFSVEGNSLARGEVRMACNGCMQRYNYTAIEAAAGGYEDFGSF
jgi:hypothetical protein